jgi:hypothetical protein
MAATKASVSSGAMRYSISMSIGPSSRSGWSASSGSDQCVRRREVDLVRDGEPDARQQAQQVDRDHTPAGDG